MRPVNLDVENISESRGNVSTNAVCFFSLTKERMFTLIVSVHPYCVRKFTK